MEQYFLWLIPIILAITLWRTSKRMDQDLKNHQDSERSEDTTQKS